MKNWRMLTAICMICALVLCFAACGAAPAQPTTQATTEATEAPTAETEYEYEVDPATFKDFIGSWYADGSSASYRIIIGEDANWTLLNSAQEAAMSGHLNVAENNVMITLFDPEGIQVMELKLEEAGKVYVEIYAESLQEVLATNHFLNTITNSIPNATDVPEDSDTTYTEPADDSNSGTSDLVPEETSDISVDESGEMDPLD